MDRILTDITTTVSEFKKNPNLEVEKANGEPFAVLTNNKASFYVLSPETYDALFEYIYDLEITPVLKERLSDKHRAVKVTLKDLIK